MLFDSPSANVVSNEVLGMSAGGLLMDGIDSTGTQVSYSSAKDNAYMRINNLPGD